MRRTDRTPGASTSPLPPLPLLRQLPLSQSHMDSTRRRKGDTPGTGSAATGIATSVRSPNSMAGRSATTAAPPGARLRSVVTP
eukprot:12689416-Alexandrium_andersonii.AAC.1